MNIQGGELLDEIKAKWPKLGVYLSEHLAAAVNNVAKQIAVSPVGLKTPPNPPNAVNVKVSGEYMHVSIADNNELNKGAQYFTEISTSPQFSQPIVIHHGASRTSHPFPLPTNDDNGSPVKYYVRSYAQYHGSQPSKPIVYGGDNPTPVTMSGATNMTLLPSSGSGTANGNGQSGGSGLGKVLVRAVPGPKRNVGSK